MPRKKEEAVRDSPFQGFASPNYTIVPDELFDQLMPTLSGAELKILLYIIRRTFGFKKNSDNISLNQICGGIQTRDGRVLDQGTGLSQSTVLIAVKGLLAKNAITAERRMSPEKGNEPTTYRLNVVTPFPENQGRGGPKIEEALPRKSGTQHTVVQETVKQPDDDDIRRALGDFGISPGQAERLATSYPASLIFDKLDVVSYLVERRSSLVSRNPQGFLIKAIEEDYLPRKPKSYKTKAEREALAAQRQQDETALERARAERAEAIATYKQHEARPIPGTKLTTTRVWEQTLATLQGQMTVANFNTWLKHTVLVDCQDGQAVIAAPSTFVATWLQTRMVPIVKRALVETIGQAVELQFTVAPELAPAAE